MDKEAPRSVAQRFFDTCALVFGGVLALWGATKLIEHIWPWLVAVLVVAGLITAGVIAYRIWNERRW